ncbi:MAG: hypothetical protein ACI81R_003403 [Bradymonadia bacterium]|jgi:hypothetical protein
MTAPRAHASVTALRPFAANAVSQTNDSNHCLLGFDRRRFARRDDGKWGWCAGIVSELCARSFTVHRRAASGKAAAVLISLVASVSCLIGNAHGQTVLVSPGTLFDVTAQEAADLVEESAWIALDQGLSVVRVYELAHIAPEFGPIAACGTDVVCYLPLRNSPVTHVLITNIEGTDSGLRVTYELVDLQVGVIVASETDVLTSASDFIGLVAPESMALSSVPRGQPASLGPPLVAPSTPARSGYVGPMISDQEPASSGALRRAGRVTASTGGALLAGGILLGFAADETQQQIQATPHPQDELVRLQDQGRSRQRLANATLITGAVAIVGGVTMVLLDRPSTDGGVAVLVETSARMTRVRLEF